MLDAELELLPDLIRRSARPRKPLPGERRPGEDESYPFRLQRQPKLRR